MDFSFCFLMGVVFTSLSLGSFFAKEELPSFVCVQFQNGDTFLLTLLGPLLPALLGLGLFHRSNKFGCNRLGVLAMAFFPCWLCPSTNDDIIISLFTYDLVFVVDVATGWWTERADVYCRGPKSTHVRRRRRKVDDHNIVSAII
jgi:hypothetical protein